MQLSPKVLVLKASKTSHALCSLNRPKIFLFSNTGAHPHPLQWTAKWLDGVVQRVAVLPQSDINTASCLAHIGLTTRWRNADTQRLNGCRQNDLCVPIWKKMPFSFPDKHNGRNLLVALKTTGASYFEHYGTHCGGMEALPAVEISSVAPDYLAPSDF